MRRPGGAVRPAMKPMTGLSGRPLLPMIEGETTEWRRYLYTEFHTHSAHNYYPQRTIRDKRFKMIHNLMPGEINPGYSFTMNRFFDGLEIAIAKTPEPVRSAYARMRQPPAFELYDLELDPYEFRNLARDPRHAETMAVLRSELQEWRRDTGDPLLRNENVIQLGKEIAACFKNGKAEKKHLSLSYLEYFFGGRN